MILLSEVIAKIACRQAEPEHLDPLLGMGMALTTGDHGQASVEAAVALTVQAGMFRTLHSMYLPQAPDSKSLVAPLLNDLYTVNFETDGDGLAFEFFFDDFFGFAVFGAGGGNFQTLRGERELHGVRTLVGELRDATKCIL